jgi:hypothetical protein
MLSCEKSEQVIAVTGVTLHRNAITLAVNQDSLLTATISPANATEQGILWTTSQPSVASVSNIGRVTALTAGTSVITATTRDGGKTATCTVTVSPLIIPVTSVAISRTTLSLDVGSSFSLTGTVSPANATNPAVTWSSSNQAVATVNDNGRVSALARGTTTITVTTADGGKTATCTVTVTLPVSMWTSFYVAPNGSNSNPGSKEQPFATIQRAQDAVEPGDTVFIRGGTYLMPADGIAAYELSNVYACVTRLTKSGTSAKRIHYFAYPGEQPVFDFSQVRPEGKRVSAFWVNASWLHIRGLEVTGVQVTIVGHTQSECFSNSGSNNIFERLDMHDNMAIGFFSRAGGNNLILNCDAYRNCDPVSDGGYGGNVDGFGSHYSNPGDGPNTFRGCRAWYNSDDGYDCINDGERTIFEHCWAFYNGYSYESPSDAFHSRGDGNGFKAGGYGANPAVSSIPNPVPRNVIEFCLSVRNKASGFYANHHAGGNDWYNNTAYYNGNNYNMLNVEAAAGASNMSDVPGYDHVLSSNLGYKPRSNELVNINKPRCTLVNNSFEPLLTFTDGDFLSLQYSELEAPRKADGSLPDINFMRLSGNNTMGRHAPKLP